tara:strand:- start:535 stop:1374 length:840 start_codon:yes stop_codon:yes gene_type:complete
MQSRLRIFNDKQKSMITNTGLLLFDIDGVIRDVTNSYRMAIKETVNVFCGWKPSIQDIDSIKSEGCWNNDWDLSLEMISRHIQNNNLSISTPTKKALIKCFESLYFGGDPNQDSNKWSGFIKNETLLVKKNLFDELTNRKISWGFISGAELPSAKFVLEHRLGLVSPPLIAMGDAPDKPDPTGFISLSSKLSKTPLGSSNHPIAYIGDTVADVKTVINARLRIPKQKFISLGIAPPHLHKNSNQDKRIYYENKLREAGTDLIIKSMDNIINEIVNLFTS